MTRITTGNIDCVGPSTPNAADCAILLNEMPVTDLWRGFGRRPSAGVDFNLPYVIEERKYRPRLKINDRESSCVGKQHEQQDEIA